MRKRDRPTPLCVSAAVTDDLAQRFISNLSSDWSDAGARRPPGRRPIRARACACAPSSSSRIVEMADAMAVASSAGPPARGARTDGAPALAGADVLVPPLVIHRHPDLWDDPERFDTERFTPERETARHRYACSPSTAVHAPASAGTSRCSSPCSRWRSCCALPGGGAQGDFLDGGDHASGEWDGAGAASGPRSGPLIHKALPCLEGRCQPVERVAGGGWEFSAWLLRALQQPVSRISHPHPAQPEGVIGGGLRTAGAERA